MTSPSAPSSHRNYHAAAYIVAAGAALWGLDALIRKPLVAGLAPSTLVLAEHVILVVVTLPWLFKSVKAASKLGIRSWIYLLIVGAGGSAGATILFTKALESGDYITPLVLQKFQPIVVIFAASILLGERLHARYFMYLAAAIAGAWLIAFPDPFAASVKELKPALLALAAASLWGLGTVLGRALSFKLEFTELTTMRFLIGLPAAYCFVLLNGDDVIPPESTFPRLILLSLVTGLIAMLLYYYGLKRTPASIATIAELAFPITATIVGYVWLNTKLNASQWIGLIVLISTVTLLSWRSNTHAEEVVDITDDKSESVIAT